MTKKLLTAFLFVVLFTAGFLFSGHALAYSTDTNDSFALTTSDLTLEKEIYKAGETIKGSFKIENPLDKQIDGVIYRVTLVGDPLPEGAFSSNLFSGVRSSEELFLAQKESKEEEFSFMLPAFIEGKRLGLRIQLFSREGYPLAYVESKEIRVTDAVAGLRITKASFTGSDGKEYGVGDIPRIGSKGAMQSARLNVSLQNPTSQSVTVVPTLEVTNRKKANVVLANVKVDPVTLSPGQEKAVSLDLPLLSDEAGMYEASFVGFDLGGRVISSQLLTRYVINDGGALISRFITENTATRKGEPITVTVSYDTVPSYILKQNDKILSVTVDIVDGKNRLVASFATTTAFMGGSITTSLEALRSADSLKGIMRLKEGEKILDERYVSFSPSFAEVPAFSVASGFLTLLVSAIIILALVFLGILIRRRKINGKVFPQIIIFLLGVSVISSLVSYAPKPASAYVFNDFFVSDYCNGTAASSGYKIRTNVGSGGSNGQLHATNSLKNTFNNETGKYEYVYPPSAKMHVEGFVSSDCVYFDTNNSPLKDATFIVKPNQHENYSTLNVDPLHVGTGEVGAIRTCTSSFYNCFATSGTGTSAGQYGGWYATYREFHLYPITASAAAGHYQINFRTHTNSDCASSGSCGGSAYGHENYWVGIPGKCGTANHGIFSSVPGANLCSKGAPSAPSVNAQGGSGNMTWYCSDGGSYSGASASCSATVLPVSDSCS